MTRDERPIKETLADLETLSRSCRSSLFERAAKEKSASRRGYDLLRKPAPSVSPEAERPASRLMAPPIAPRPVPARALAKPARVRWEAQRAGGTARGLLLKTASVLVLGGALATGLVLYLARGEQPAPQIVDVQPAAPASAAAAAPVAALAAVPQAAPAAPARRAGEPNPDAVKMVAVKPVRVEPAKPQPSQRIAQSMAAAEAARPAPPAAQPARTAEAAPIAEAAVQQGRAATYDHLDHIFTKREPTSAMAAITAVTRQDAPAPSPTQALALAAPEKPEAVEVGPRVSRTKDRASRRHEREEAAAEPEALRRGERLPRGTVAKARALIRKGDLPQARMLLQRGVNANDPEALTAMGESYDPQVLASAGLVGVMGSTTEARAWYDKAKSAGARGSRKVQGFAKVD